VSAGGACAAAASSAASSAACCLPPPARTFDCASTLPIQLQPFTSPVPCYAMPCFAGRPPTLASSSWSPPRPPTSLVRHLMFPPPCPAAACARPQHWGPQLAPTPGLQLLHRLTKPTAATGLTFRHVLAALPLCYMPASLHCCLQTRPATLSSRRCARTPPSAPQCTCCCATPGCAPTRWGQGE
jgi:hypothetical protein